MLVVWIVGTCRIKFHGLATGTAKAHAEALYQKHEPQRVQVRNNHILPKILTYITTILKPST